MENLKIPPFCKEGTEECNCSVLCYPVLLLENFTKASLIPKKYQKATPENLPIKEENSETYSIVMRYLNKTPEVVQDGKGLFFYPLISKENPLGVGTGKTTTACTIGNYYLKRRIIEHLKAKNKIIHNPVLFLQMASFQNVYNSQFSGSLDSKNEAADRFQSLKDMAEKTELLILDDIGIRGADTFLNILFEVVDFRVNQEKTMIFTSNLPLNKVAELLGDRIASRIAGSTTSLGFKGKDHRGGF